MWDRITIRLPRKSVMASRAYKPGEYFRRSVLAKSFEQSSEQSEDNSVDTSRKYPDDDEPVVDKSTRESRSTRKDVDEDLPRENQRSHREKEKRPSRLNLQQKSLRRCHGHRKRLGYS